jgi:hypothetical protein
MSSFSHLPIADGHGSVSAAPQLPEGFDATGAKPRGSGHARSVTRTSEASMSVTHKDLTTNLFLIEELDDTTRRGEIADSDLEALRAVAEWIDAFVIKPHKDLGRSGPVCPFTPGALERHTLWLALEHIADRGVPEVVELIRDYQTLFLQARPTDGDDTIYKAIFVVFTDLPADRAQGILGDALDQLAVSSYDKDGFVMGPFYEGNAGTALYNASFHPFTSPVPSVLVRPAVVSDWKFFLDHEAFFPLWAHRYGESGTRELAAEMRRLPWRTACG